MSKYDGDIRAMGESLIEPQELLAALGRPPQIAADRQDAMAHYLSGEEGWNDASKALAGTFAKPSRQGTELTVNQDR